MFTSEDYEAINSFDTTKNIYLTVVGQGEEAHLGIAKRNWLGRLWMMLGFSDSSLEKVAKYIDSRAQALITLPNDKAVEKVNAFRKAEKLSGGIEKLEANLKKFKMLHHSIIADVAHISIGILKENKHRAILRSDLLSRCDALGQQCSKEKYCAKNHSAFKMLIQKVELSGFIEKMELASFIEKIRMRTL